jgi:hypothetical protein
MEVKVTSSARHRLQRHPSSSAGFWKADMAAMGDLAGKIAKLSVTGYEG